MEKNNEGLCKREKKDWIRSEMEMKREVVKGGGGVTKKVKKDFKDSGGCNVRRKKTRTRVREKERENKTEHSGGKEKQRQNRRKNRENKKKTKKRERKESMSNEREWKSREEKRKKNRYERVGEGNSEKYTMKLK